MTSRRRLLGLFGLSAVGLSGCLNNDGNSSDGPPTDNETGQPTQTETQSPTPTPEQKRTPGETNTPGQTTSTPTETMPPGREFETVYDVVEQGADPTGDEYVDDTLSSLVADDTLLEFPPGTYYLNDLAVENVTNFGMRGCDTTIRLNEKGRAIFLRFSRVEDIYMSGFSIDNTAPNTAAWCAIDVMGGDNVIEDYTVEGFVDVTSRTNGFTIMVEGSRTSLRLEDVDLSRGAINSAATFVFPQREFENPSRSPGSLTFKNCIMKGWGKEGLYASPHSGPIKVIGGEYANNAIVQVRVGSGNAPERAIVRDVTVTVDRVPEYMPEGNRNLRGIWLKEGDMATVENCDITLENISEKETSGGLLINDQFGRATVRNCNITVDGIERPAIDVEKPTETYDAGRMPSLDHLPPAWDVTLEEVWVNGRQTRTEGIRIDRRANCTLSDINVDNDGHGADGVLLRGVDQCRILDGSIISGEIPVVLEFQEEQDDCVLDFRRTSLRSTNLETDEEPIEQDEEHRYCLGPTTLGGNESTSTLGLTRTKRVLDETNSATETNGGRKLYGRWLQHRDS